MKDFDHRPTGPCLLDDPVKSACQSAWSGWVETRGAAQALPPHMGQFCWVDPSDPSAGKDLQHLLDQRTAPLLFLQKHVFDVPAHVHCLTSRDAVQMTLRAAPEIPDMDGIELLKAQDAPEMLALATVSKPGPFAIGTPKLGRFLGLRLEGRLVAMAGQRMAFPGWAEVSGVCVHPDYQGQGKGARLVRAMTHLLLSQGRRPFLHTYADNLRAIALYERLGFEVRSDMHMMAVGMPGLHIA